MSTNDPDQLTTLERLATAAAFVAWLAFGAAIVALALAGLFT